MSEIKKRFSIGSMSDEEIITEVWPGLVIVKKLGSGSFGSVYQTENTNPTIRQQSAVKIVRFPQIPDEARVTAEAMGLDTEKKLREYYEPTLQKLLDEVRLMDELKTSGAVVTIQDFACIETTDPFGWVILIRMELLESLGDFRKEHEFSEDDVLSIANDICRALRICHQRNIIHRDVKETNIFRSEHGTYKLGDFGISRHMESNAAELSHKGTSNYMAPEIVRGESYDFRVDIYALGIVMYRLLNKNRLPFLPTEGKLTLNTVEDANAKRLAGADLPDPINASPELAAIIRKAGAADPDDRYASAEELREALSLYSLEKKRRTASQSAGASEAADEYDDRTTAVGDARLEQLAALSRRKREAQIAGDAVEQTDATIADVPAASAESAGSSHETHQTPVSSAAAVVPESANSGKTASKGSEASAEPVSPAAAAALFFQKVPNVQAQTGAPAPRPYATNASAAAPYGAGAPPPAGSSMPAPFSGVSGGGSSDRSGFINLQKDSSRNKLFIIILICLALLALAIGASVLVMSLSHKDKKTDGLLDFDELISDGEDEELSDGETEERTRSQSENEDRFEEEEPAGAHDGETKKEPTKKAQNASKEPAPSKKNDKKTTKTTAKPSVKKTSKPREKATKATTKPTPKPTQPPTQGTPPTEAYPGSSGGVEVWVIEDGDYIYTYNGTFDADGVFRYGTLIIEHAYEDIWEVSVGTHYGDFLIEGQLCGKTYGQDGMPVIFAKSGTFALPGEVGDSYTAYDCLSDNYYDVWSAVSVIYDYEIGDNTYSDLNTGGAPPNFWFTPEDVRPI